MPSKSVAQHLFFAAIAHNPDFAKKVGVAQKVGKDFVKADKKVKDTTDNDSDFETKSDKASEKKKGKK